MSELLRTHGWIVDPTITDYGEDLVVQIVKDEVVTPNRFYLQVKGTRSLNRYQTNGIYRYGRLDRRTVTRWLESNDVVILAVWDVKSKRGVFGPIRLLFSMSGLVGNTNRTLTAVFPQWALIDQHNFKVLEFMALEQFIVERHSVVEHLNEQLKASWGVQWGSPEDEEVLARWLLLSVRHLIDLGIIRIVGRKEAIRVDKRFEQLVGTFLRKPLPEESYKREYKARGESPSPVNTVEIMYIDAFNRALAIWLNERYSSPLSKELLIAGVQALFVFYHDVIQKSTEEVKQRIESG